MTVLMLHSYICTGGYLLDRLWSGKRRHVDGLIKDWPKAY
jgi:hypothetical protein